MIRRDFLAVGAASLLGACVGTGVRDSRPGGARGKLWRQRQARLDAFVSWDMDGRMAVRTADDGGSASFFWQREAERHRIEMFGPFGGGRVTIEQDADGAVMRDGNDEQVEAATAEALLFMRVGWHVPFESLSHWLKGVPSPEPYDDLELDELGRAIAFAQDGFRVRVLDYDAGEPDDLPRRVFVEALPGTVHLVDEDGRDLGDRLEVKVVIRGWRPLTPAEMR
jgi:outer membrane lipoprotein LolB